MIASALSFSIKQLFASLFSFHFQIKDSDTHVHAHLWLPNDGDRNHAVKQPSLEAVSFITCFYIG